MSQDALFNEHWYRVKALKPRLSGDVVIRRHVYRGVPSYVLYRQCSNSVHRASTQTFELLGKLDGSLTIDQLWQLALQKQGEEAPSQSALMELLGQLHEAELLVIDRRLSAEHLFTRSKENNRQDFKQRYLNPLFMRFRLYDPDKLLTSINPYLGWVFSRTAAMMWLLIIVFALIEMTPLLSTLRFELSNLELLTPLHTMLFALVYPVLKLVHELSHGLMVKRFGGVVHEMGISLMVLLPIPYVDASYASVLPEKRERMLISAAGIFVECTIAALAAIIWVSSSGTVHHVALIVMLIGGLSTILFNANPLLKFDGYYVLSDWLEIPNLAQKSKTYIQSSTKNILFGLGSIDPEPVDTRERYWLIAYGVLSGLYRVGLMFAIAWMLSGKYFFFGALLAIWVFVTVALMPIYRFGRFIQTQSTGLRTRAIGLCTAIFGFILIPVFYLPVPYSSFAEGVVWLPDHAVVRVASDCEVTELVANPNSFVFPGDKLFVCGSPELESRISILQAKLDEVEAKSYGLGIGEQVDQIQLANEADSIAARLQRERDKFNNQILIAKAAGKFVVKEPTQLPGSYFSQGDIAAFIVPPDSRTVRMIVQENDIVSVQGQVKSVELKFAELADSNKTFVSSIRRQKPKAGLQVPSVALTTVGGGALISDPTGDGYTVLEPVFDIELNWPETAPLVNVGSHVFVKLEHPSKPLAGRFMSSMKRAFLGRVGA